jgi:pimeloyl-ACP methyl ester carboxylesterase
MAVLTAIPDFVLRQLFRLIVLLFQSTFLRLLLASSLFPVYCFVQTLSLLPSIVAGLPSLLTTRGRTSLVVKADAYRKHEQEIATGQYDGTYRFSPANVLRWDGRISWDVDRAAVDICGISARVVHAKSTRQAARPLIMLHGNPSWSYIWRDMIPDLAAAGYEVFAVDWLGHGTSDKPLRAAEITFELHMHTLRTVIDRFDLHEFYIAAHDWGGCVALCTIPTLPAERRCEGLFLLNTFLPPRPTDISLHYYLLYWIWFFSTGVMGPLLPESAVLRFMAPNLSVASARVYSEPYRQSMFKTKASIGRFSHLVPGLPDWIYSLRQTNTWRLIEGLLGPEHLTNVNAQALLAGRNEWVRQWWSGHGDGKTPTTRNAPEAVMILFGRDDPLLPEFKHVLENTIRVGQVVQAAEDGWLSGAGHYPFEQKPKEITHCLTQLPEIVKGGPSAVE